MPRPPRVDVANGLYHTLNRGNLRADIFKKPADFVAFEKILFEALERFKVELYCYQLMSSRFVVTLNATLYVQAWSNWRAPQKLFHVI